MKQSILTVVSLVLIPTFFIQPLSTFASLEDSEMNPKILVETETVIVNEQSAVADPVVPIQDETIEIVTPQIEDNFIQEVTVHTDTSEVIIPEPENDVTKESLSSDYVEGEVLVKFKDNKIKLTTATGRTAAKKFAGANSLEKEEDFVTANSSILNITDSSTVEEKIIELEKDSRVEYAEPNYKRYPTVIVDNDTYKDQLWGLYNSGQTVAGAYASNNPGETDKDIDASEAWGINEGTNADIIVAVIDTGVAYNHPDLRPNMWDGTACKKEDGTELRGCYHGYDYRDNDKIPLPSDFDHGTHVAGTIAAVKNNGMGIIGVAPRAKIMALRFGYDVASEIKAIDFAIQNGAKVINASFTGHASSSFEYEAIKRFKDAGGIFVAAAGNGAGNNENTHSYPSDYDLENIISVAATDQSDALASFSNYGATSVDVGAPGTNIYSTVPSEITVLSETFETVPQFAVPADWVTDESVPNNWGTSDFSGDMVLYGDTTLPYADNVDATILSPSLNTSGSDASLSFSTQCDTEYDTDFWKDYMTLEFSDNDGATYTEMKRWDEASLDMQNEEYPLDDTNGSFSVFTDVPISDEYITNDFKFRFRWISNSEDNNYSGCFVDDILIKKLSDGSDEQYAYYSGTSMATPHVAGLVALLEGYNPNLTPVQVKDIILNSGDSVESLLATTVSGKRINAYRALAEVYPAKAITAFTIPAQIGTTTIDENTHAITVSVATGAVVTSLQPTITTTGISVSPASDIPQDFTQPVSYTVTAFDGSTQTYEVTVLFVSDSTPPVITLIGSNPVNLFVGEIFTDPGATAMDNFDGVITHSIVATGTVDVGTAGTYTVIYTVTDGAGNTSTRERVVNVNEPVAPPAPPAPPVSSGGGGGSSRSAENISEYSVKINGNAREVDTTTVLLSITPVTNIKQMRVSNEANFSGATWTPFKSKYSWTLTPGSGLKTVYVQYGKNDKVVGKAKDDIKLVEKNILTSSSPSASLPSPAPSNIVSASTFWPTETFVIGARGQNVVELQKMLITAGYLKIIAPTGYYGPMTKSAYEAYQNAQKITPPLPTVISIEQKALLLQELQKKLVELLAELKTLSL